MRVITRGTETENGGGIDSLLFSYFGYSLEFRQCPGWRLSIEKKNERNF